jgi:NhaP-type Na+/H+ or K+/H+ antiporter
LETQQAILNAWERHLIRREGDLREALPAAVAVEFDRRLHQRVAELRRVLLEAFLMVLLLLFLCSGFVGLIAHERFGWLEWAAFSAAIVSAIPLCISLRRWGRAESLADKT